MHSELGFNSLQRDIRMRVTGRRERSLISPERKAGWPLPKVTAVRRAAHRFAGTSSREREYPSLMITRYRACGLGMIPDHRMIHSPRVPAVYLELAF